MTLIDLETLRAAAGIGSPAIKPIRGKDGLEYYAIVIHPDAIEMAWEKLSQFDKEYGERWVRRVVRWAGRSELAARTAYIFAGLEITPRA